MPRQRDNKGRYTKKNPPTTKLLVGAGPSTFELAPISRKPTFK